MNRRKTSPYPSSTITRTFLLLALLWAAGSAAAAPVEPKGYRLLSVTESTKLILVSDLASKQKYVLDASTAKITVDGKPAEFSELERYVLIKVDFEAKKGSKEGVDTDGVVKQIVISTPDNPK